MNLLLNFHKLHDINVDFLSFIFLLQVIYKYKGMGMLTAQVILRL